MVATSTISISMPNNPSAQAYRNEKNNKKVSHTKVISIRTIKNGWYGQTRFEWCLYCKK